MSDPLSFINQIVWGAPALFLILGVGLYFTFRLGVVQLRLLPASLKAFFRKLIPGQKDGSFRALCTALGATVGTGNLVGVAGAICLGGPGAVFWMWICGILGMVTKYAEAVLAVRYRVRAGNTFLGGPMYVIREGLGRRYLPLAKLYCLFGMVAAFGVGNAAQINAVVTGMEIVSRSAFGSVPRLLAPAAGLVLTVFLGMLLLGGAERIAAAAELVVPLAAAGYILLCLGILIPNARKLPWAVSTIISGAFSPKAVTGGALGSAFQALRIGCSRGVFTNEAGMGTASIAHGSAEVSHPAEQGLMGIVEVFLDTIVICTLTALTILVSGVVIPYGVDTGAELTMAAFSVSYGPMAELLLTVMLTAFAVATVLGWSYYGGCCARFLFGSSAWRIFAWAQTGFAFVSSLLNTAAVWQFSEVVNGLMLIPNLVALVLLSPEAVRLTAEFRTCSG